MSQEAAREEEYGVWHQVAEQDLALIVWVARAAVEQLWRLRLLLLPLLGHCLHPKGKWAGFDWRDAALDAPGWWALRPGKHGGLSTLVFLFFYLMDEKKLINCRILSGLRTQAGCLF